MPIANLDLHTSSLWMFYGCMALGLVLHVMLKIDAWYKPATANEKAPTLTDYFRLFPLRTAISAASTLLVGLLLWEYNIRDAIAGAAAGYIGNSVLDGLLGQRGFNK